MRLIKGAPISATHVNMKNLLNRLPAFELKSVLGAEDKCSCVIIFLASLSNAAVFFIFDYLNLKISFTLQR